jgi:hypothetical protein
MLPRLDLKHEEVTPDVMGVGVAHGHRPEFQDSFMVP